MKILIGFEESQEVCKAFRNLGFEAYGLQLCVCCALDSAVGE